MTAAPADTVPDRADRGRRPRVVIVGCGFGGLEAARSLARAEVDVTLVDRTNHHLFQPLLYQVATAGLSAPAHRRTPWRRIRFSGRAAWLFWLFAHIYFLIGFRNRLVVLIDWASAYWSAQRYARVVTGIAPRSTDD